MKDLTRTMEITMKEMDEEDATDDDEKAKSSEAKPGPSSPGIPGEKVISSDTSSFPQGGVPSVVGNGASPVPPTEATPNSELPLPPKASPTASRSSTPRPRGVPTRQMLMDKSEEDVMAAEGLTEEEKELKRKKKAGMSKKQREAYMALQAEQRETRQKRIDILTRKLVDRISVWTETDKGPEVTHSFNEKTKFEVENLKMESFGIEILHGEFILVQLSH